MWLCMAVGDILSGVVRWGGGEQGQVIFICTFAWVLLAVVGLGFCGGNWALVCVS